MSFDNWMNFIPHRPTGYQMVNYQHEYLLILRYHTNIIFMKTEYLDRQEAYSLFQNNITRILWVITHTAVSHLLIVT